MIKCDYCHKNKIKYRILYLAFRTGENECYILKNIVDVCQKCLIIFKLQNPEKIEFRKLTFWEKFSATEIAFMSYIISVSAAGIIFCLAFLFR